MMEGREALAQYMDLRNERDSPGNGLQTCQTHVVVVRIRP